MNLLRLIKNIFRKRSITYDETMIYVSDIVEVGVFIDGEFTGGSLKVSIGIPESSIRGENTIDNTIDKLEKIIDVLDHTNITSCNSIFEKCDRSILVKDVLFINDSFFDIYKVITLVLEYLLVTNDIPVQDSIITIEHIDSKYKLESKLPLVTWINVIDVKIDGNITDNGEIFASKENK